MDEYRRSLGGDPRKGSTVAQQKRQHLSCYLEKRKKRSKLKASISNPIHRIYPNINPSATIECPYYPQLLCLWPWQQCQTSYILPKGAAPALLSPTSLPSGLQEGSRLVQSCIAGPSSALKRASRFYFLASKGVHLIKKKIKK